jgi:superfamily II DNA or RNA helicase
MPANSIDDRKTCDERESGRAQPLPPGVAAGASVLLRGERWRVDAIVAHEDCRALHLTRALDGARRVLLWPFDRPAAIDQRPRLRVVRPHRWLATVRRRACLDVDPVTPRAATAGVEIIPYQLAPAVAVASGVSRLLLADEVGLGKTIQAGWIVADLIAREPGARVLIAVPAGLRHQWTCELAARFAIHAGTVDARWLRSAVADLPADVSPWTPPGVFVGSLDFLKRPDVAASIALHAWDLLVVDEAHTATAPTDRHAALVRFAARARRIVAITATPYSGSPAGFASLTGLGATRPDEPPLMFRRSRQDVGDPRKRRHHFVRVRIARAEAQLQRLLERYSRDVWKEATLDVEGARLAVTILRKRALSSPAAAARSLRRRLELLQGRAHPPRQLPLFDDEDLVDDDVPPAALATPGLADAAREQRWLASLVAAADTARGVDSKLRYVKRLVSRLHGESAVIFTEYRDTLLHLAGSLPPALHLHGGLTAAERVLVQAQFNRDGGLLLATDAAAEGLNLQQRCRLVVNYELPWNPARLEQRIGRVDRIGQRRMVHALTLTARDTAEDLVIGSLARRLTRVVATLGAGDRLGAFLDDARTAGIVIGGDPVGESYGAGHDETALVVRHDGSLEAAGTAARLLRAARAVASEPEERRFPPDIVVSGIRARGESLPPGYAIVVACTARTDDGFLAAERQIVLHSPDKPARLSTADGARRLASALRDLPDLRAIVPEIERWFADVRDAHAAAVDRRLAREYGISEQRSDRTALQPGLFDRRAVTAAEQATAAGERLLEDHRRHTLALQRSRALHLTCVLSAVLVAWR